MTFNFGFESIQSTEFGIGRDDEGKESFSLIPVDQHVQNALKEMIADTRAAMRETGEPDEYQPSEKYSSQEYVYISTDNELATRLRDLHRANNLPVNSAALKEPG